MAARLRPSEVKASHTTGRRWPVSVRSHWPVARFQTVTAPLPSVEASRAPSRETASDRAESVKTTCPDVASHTAVVSLPRLGQFPEANVRAVVATRRRLSEVYSTLLAGTCGV